MSRLLKSEEEFSKELLSKNKFTKGDRYNVAHSRALSDGDDFGKGLNGGNVGSATDITTRNGLLAKNMYTKSNPYNIKNA